MVSERGTDIDSVGYFRQLNGVIERDSYRQWWVLQAAKWCHGEGLIQTLVGTSGS
jgi:hypothetical protein